MLNKKSMSNYERPQIGFVMDNPDAHLSTGKLINKQYNKNIFFSCLFLFIFYAGKLSNICTT